MMNKSIVDIEERAKEAGYRNFISFVFIKYFTFNAPATLKDCGEELGVSSSKFRKSILEYGWKPRQGGNHDPVGRRHTIDIWKKTKQLTSFIFPWCMFYHYYWKIKLTTYEIGSLLSISQSSVQKYMKMYKIKRRKQAHGKDL